MSIAVWKRQLNSINQSEFYKDESKDLMNEPNKKFMETEIQEKEYQIAELYKKIRDIKEKYTNRPKEIKSLIKTIKTIKIKNAFHKKQNYSLRVRNTKKEKYVRWNH
jgi:peptidoglycan hydrolase CwlO-like protein